MNTPYGSYDKNRLIAEEILGSFGLVQGESLNFSNLPQIQLLHQGTPSNSLNYSLDPDIPAPFEASNHAVDLNYSNPGEQAHCPIELVGITSISPDHFV